MKNGALQPRVASGDGWSNLRRLLMTKWTLVVILGVLALVGPASAATVNVDFSNLTSTYNITVGATDSSGNLLDPFGTPYYNPQMVNGVLPSYDPQGGPTDDPTYAALEDQFGLSAPTDGALTLNFVLFPTVTRLHLRFKVLGLSTDLLTAPDVFGIFGTTESADYTATGFTPGDPSATGYIDFNSSSTFSTATFYTAPISAVSGSPYRVEFDQINYDATVPEPGTFLLFGLGLAGLGAARLRRRT